ncbi:unnamed protein product [Vicia faba]|uniref:Uncharacterized protein n=1 Tax=Vicia faba TaxID=3906 RepID=A0AAV1AVC0_VICFA|nr:unnamed protein product [Vicia faba]
MESFTIFYVSFLHLLPQMKMKEILQTLMPKSKMDDEATWEALEESNWGMDLMICRLINTEEFNVLEVNRHRCSLFAINLRRRRRLSARKLFFFSYNLMSLSMV